jgi:hypothetical protein
MHIISNFKERRRLLSVETELGLMISFGSFTAMLIFGILTLVNKMTKRSNRHFSEPLPVK